MSTEKNVTTVSLMDYAPQDSYFAEKTLPELVALFDAKSVTVEVLPSIQPQGELKLPASPSAQEGKNYVVFYDNAIQKVQQALKLEMAPTAALMQWQKEIKALVQFHRANRRCVLLVDRAAAARDLRGFAQTLATHLELGDLLPGTPVAPQQDTGTVEAVIAAQTLAQSTQAKRLSSELEARSLPLGDTASLAPCDPDKAYTEMAQNAELQAEHDLLLLQLEAVQNEREEHYAAQVAQRDQIADLQKQITALKQKQTQEDQRHAAQLKEAKAKNDSLISQLENVKKVRDAHHAAQIVQKDQIADLQKQITALKQKQTQADQRHAAQLKEAKAKNDSLISQLENVKKVRDAHRAETATQKKQIANLQQDLSRVQEDQQSISAENSLLLLQLNNVQEELETYYLKAQKLEKSCRDHEKRFQAREAELTSAAQTQLQEISEQLNSARQELETAKQELETAKADIVERDKKLEEAHQHSARVEDELHQILQSSSWRVTGPLRRIKDRMLQPQDPE